MALKSLAISIHHKEPQAGLPTSLTPSPRLTFILTKLTFHSVAPLRRTVQWLPLLTVAQGPQHGKPDNLSPPQAWHPSKSTGLIPRHTITLCLICQP